MSLLANPVFVNHDYAVLPFAANYFYANGESVFDSQPQDYEEKKAPIPYRAPAARRERCEKCGTTARICTSATCTKCKGATVFPDEPKCIDCIIKLPRCKVLYCNGQLKPDCCAHCLTTRVEFTQYTCVMCMETHDSCLQCAVKSWCYRCCESVCRECHSEHRLCKESKDIGIRPTFSPFTSSQVNDEIAIQKCHVCNEGSDIVNGYCSPRECWDCAEEERRCAACNKRTYTEEPLKCCECNVHWKKLFAEEEEEETDEKKSAAVASPRKGEVDFIRHSSDSLDCFEKIGLPSVICVSCRHNIKCNACNNWVCNSCTVKNRHRCGKPPIKAVVNVEDEEEEDDNPVLLKKRRVCIEVE